ncbi:MAG: coproporphyrinogen dehydrogenase HemZ [Clostridia bacterium]|nr:coproporphyrinogen dehydrogenase HemZ [Clostridia bacterium]
MTPSAESEGRRLFLYHLIRAFFHEKSACLTAHSRREGDTVAVMLENGAEKGVGKAEVKLSLHREPGRAENAAVGLAFARAARHFTDYVPPYGTLIGVRPVKVPLFYLNEGDAEETVKDTLTEEFLVSAEKAELLLALAKTEMHFYPDRREGDAVLYVSIPFCPSRCSYCSFVSSAAPKHLALIPRYLSLLTEELRLTAALFRKEGRRLLAVYVGGGTPGILKAEEMQALLGVIREAFDCSALREFCVEMGRPDTVTEEKLLVLAQAGVDRISINSQTTCDETLSRIGRKHSAADFFEAMALAKKFPFKINCDLISALPGETPEIFLQSVSQTLALGPENLTLHALCQKRSAEDQNEKEFSERFAPAVKKAHEACIKAGLVPYYLYRQKMSDAELENLGFATPEAIGVYNLFMMEDLCDVFACGAGAISKLIPREKGGRIHRFAGFKYPFEYLDHPERIGERLGQMQY